MAAQNDDVLKERARCLAWIEFYDEGCGCCADERIGMKKRLDGIRSGESPSDEVVYDAKMRKELRLKDGG